jgi:O-antigen/teichoic acid export membrane protein
VRGGVRLAGPLALAGLVANGSNVIVTVLLAHLLVTTDYGYLNQLIGLFLIVSNPGSAVIVAVVRRATAWRVLGRNEDLRAWARRIHRWAAVGFAAYAVLVVALSNVIARSVLSQDTPGRVVVMLLGAGLWVVLCIDRGFLQATRHYGDLSVNLLVEGGVRAVAVLGLVAIYPHVVSACAGIFIAELATLLHARWRANRDLALADTEVVLVTSADRVIDATIVRDLVTAVCAMALLAVLQSADVILLGRDDHAASGSYAAISVASKSLFFIAVVLGGYLVPEAAIRWRQGRHALSQLWVTLLILAVPAGILLVLATVAPHLVLSLVFSSKYLGAQDAFATLVLAMCCLAVTVVLTLYLLAIAKRWIVGLLAAGSVALVVAVQAAHGQPLAVARADLAVQGILVVAVALAFALAHVRDHRTHPVARGNPDPTHR